MYEALYSVLCSFFRKPVPRATAACSSVSLRPCDPDAGGCRLRALCLPNHETSQLGASPRVRTLVAVITQISIPPPHEALADTSRALAHGVGVCDDSLRA